MRSRRLWVLLALILLLVLGHWAFWYRARERTALPDAASLAGRVYLAGDLPYRAWLPYPHQNVAQLENGVGDLEALIGAVARLNGNRAPELPAFGSTRLPPSSELVVASDESGERFIAVARVYPVVGFLARWAGRLAGNPLLEGGRAEVGGRPVDVRWQEGEWVVASPGVIVPAQAGESTVAEASLTLLRLEISRGVIPAGEYRLRRTEGDLELVAGREEDLEELQAIGANLPPVPLLAAESDTGGARSRARILGVLPGVRSLAGMPGLISGATGMKRWRLPGEKVLRLIGDGPPETVVQSWKVAALDGESLALADQVVEFSQHLYGVERLTLASWVEVEAARAAVRQIVEALEAIPVVGRREARRWRALEEVLVALRGQERLTVLVGAGPTAVRVRLHAWSTE